MVVQHLNILLKYRRAYSDGRYIHSNTRATRQATKDLILILKKQEKETKRIIIMNDDEQYRKTNWIKMVSDRDRVGEKQRDRKRKDTRKM